MKIENSVEVAAPLDRVWALVNDIPQVAPCMPGASLTGVVDERTYEGTVAVKLGPLRMSYKGRVVVEEVDEANHSARLAASGKDTKGAGTARATVDTRLESIGDGRTRMVVSSDVQLTGRVASFGRGGAINDVAAKLFGQFADCLRDTLEAPPAPAAGAGGAAEATAGAPVPAGEQAAEAPAGAEAAAAAPPPAPVRAARPVEVGGLIVPLVTGVFKALARAIAALFRRLFGRRQGA
jgi:carbon monoxide dehydrogenase subunit G